MAAEEAAWEDVPPLPNVEEVRVLFFCIPACSITGPEPQGAAAVLRDPHLCPPWSGRAIPRLRLRHGAHHGRDETDRLEVREGRSRLPTSRARVALRLSRGDWGRQW